MTLREHIDSINYLIRICLLFSSLAEYSFFFPQVRVPPDIVYCKTNGKVSNMSCSSHLLYSTIIAILPLLTNSLIHSVPSIRVTLWLRLSPADGTPRRLMY
ncbi:hypothetical protein EDC04DRAFT_2752237 [Pisolithus marmoratus]|nr:hypothetical protein EDC04DRAFT_2752237 [Pisolithus marmoratus]